MTSNKNDIFLNRQNREPDPCIILRDDAKEYPFSS